MIIKKLMKKIMVTVIALSVMFIFAISSFAGNVTIAPQFMPNFPMLAGDNVMVMWIPVPGAAKYVIYQNDKSIGEAPAPPFTAPAPKDPGNYSYTIAGVDASGAEGPKSTANVISITIILPPTGLRHQMLGGLLNLGWDPAADAVIYDVFKSETKEGPFKLVISTTEDKYIDADVKQEESAGKSFFYKVQSKDRFNKMSVDSEIYEVKIVKEILAEIEKDLKLKIMRTKNAGGAIPMGAGSDLKSVYGAKMFADRKSCVLTDPYNMKVQVIDYRGDFVKKIGEVGPKPEQMGSPNMLEVDSEDNIYITDVSKLDKFFAYDSNGNLLYAGKAHTVTEEAAKGKTEGKGEYTNAKLFGVAAFGDKLYIGETNSGTIQIYNKADGEFVGYFSNKKTGEILTFGAPGAISIDSKGEKIYIGRSLARIIDVFDLKSGEKLYVVGKAKSFVGAFMSVTGMCFDKDGNLVVTDGVMRSVQVFSKEDGSYMYHIGDAKAIPDKSSKDQRAFVNNMESPLLPLFDYKERLWLFIPGMKGFMIREYNPADKVWDIAVDKPEGESPQ